MRFREISETYDLLRDPGRRSAFDARGFDPGGGGSRGFGGFGGGPRPGERGLPHPPVSPCRPCSHAAAPPHTCVTTSCRPCPMPPHTRSTVAPLPTCVPDDFFTSVAPWVVSMFLSTAFVAFAFHVGCLKAELSRIEQDLKQRSLRSRIEQDLKQAARDDELKQRQAARDDELRQAARDHDAASSSRAMMLREYEMLRQAELRKLKGAQAEELRKLNDALMNLKTAVGSSETRRMTQDVSMEEITAMQTVAARYMRLS